MIDFSYLTCYFWNHLAYLGIYDQPINYHILLNLVRRDLVGLKGLLPFRGTFPIGNLILGFFEDTFFQKNYGVTSLGISFLFYFPF